MEQPVTKELKLDNGLKVLVREDHRAPVVVSQIWYKVGSGFEHRGITGISHALEHMMFQGTPTLPEDKFAVLIAEHGGTHNAFTNDDYTAYYEELDASNLSVSFQAEADRMSQLSLTPEAFEKEIQVVIEERRMRTDDNPQSILWERYMAIAYPIGPYHHPVIGWRDDLDHMTVEQLRHWYERWYVPNNATLVVVGDVNAEAVFALAKQYFGPVPARPIRPVTTTTELTSLGEKRFQLRIPAKVPYGIWGFEVPSLKTAKDETEAYALMVASSILDGGNSTRFPKELVRGAQVASNIGTHYNLLKQYDTHFFIAGIPAGNHTMKDLEQKVMAQIDRLKNELVPQEELDRTKTQILAKEVFEKDSMSDQAIILGILETIGLPWRLVEVYPEKIKAVTPAQIQAVARKYFKPEKLTFGELIPTESEPKKEAARAS